MLFCCCVVISKLFFNISNNKTNGLRVDYETAKAQFDRSGWRIISSSELTSESYAMKDRGLIRTARQDSPSSKFDPIINRLSSDQLVGSNFSIKPNRSSKLIEWDDDELNDHDILQLKDNQVANLNEVNKEQSFRFGPKDLPTSYLDDSPRFSRDNNKKTSSANKFNRLIYHGQLKQNNTKKVIDGIELHIRTHKPLIISRRSFGPPTASTNTIISPRDPDLNQDGYSTTNKDPNWATPIQSQESSGLSSDWRPLVVISRSRRSGKTHKSQIDKRVSKNNETKASLAPNLPLDYKWKPITKEPINSMFDLNKMKPLKTSSSSIDKDFDANSVRSSSSSSIEEPFDDDFSLFNVPVPADKDRDQSKHGSGLKAQGQFNLERMSPSNGADKWTPVAETTTSQDLTASPSSVGSITTTPLPTTTTTTPGNSSESAQRSASDLNYIYSSQPVVQNNQAQGANSYYSNYVMQPSSQPPVADQPQLPIIDTTSGQAPEMIADRAPEVAAPAPPAPANDYGYSLPQTMASFQPAQPPPRQAPAYGSYEIGVPAASFHVPGPQQQFRQLPPAPSVRQLPTGSPPAQVVRQEHHYHYYNQQQPTATSERQVTFANNQQQPQTVIRELQPIMISQPIIQQTSSTTTPPLAQQIIREIVKEVPVPAMQLQPIQVQRVIVPPPVPVPIAPTHEVIEPPSSGYAAYAPAQRIIRQLSNSIPQVSIRMPALSQFRLQMPAVQLPVRAALNPAPVTRHTGSFVIPPMPRKTTTLLTETQVVPSHTTIMQTTQFTPATRTTVYTTDHQPAVSASSAYKR